MKALIGKKAPEFHAPAVVNGNEIIEDFSLEQYVGKKYVVMFFYPMDFTFVCPTELHAFQQKLQEFERRNVAVVGCSVDSQFSHFAWLNQDKNKGGIHGVTYPLRNVDEALRMVDALQHFEEYGEVCPANWSKGKDAMKATNAGVSNYLSHH